MSDSEIIKQMNESKVQQELRDCLVSGETFSTSDELHQKVFQEFNEMSESQKQQFTQKGWKNG